MQLMNTIKFSTNLYSDKHVEFLDSPLGYTMPLNLPSGLGGGSFTVMIIDPDRHCIRTVGSFVNTMGSAMIKRNRRRVRDMVGSIVIN